MAHNLIIDDEQPLRHTISAILKAAGHTTAEAENGAKVASFLRNEKFDLIITDILMPECDGLETIMNLQRENQRIPIIAMTGMPVDSALYLKTAKHLGAWRTILKPFSAPALLSVINGVLEEAKHGW